MTDLDASGFVHTAKVQRSKLLIVDDQPVNIQALYQIFKDEHEVFMATNGEQALAEARGKQPDLILLDIVMPGMDGLQVCKALKSDPATQSIPVIFVTSQDDPNDEARGLACGAVDFISKPISPPVVQARAHTHLLLKQQSDLLRKMAYIDGLTGVANRRKFNEQIEIDWRAAQRAHSSLGAIILDIDHFKLYNDHYGHQAGDACIAAIAQALHAQLGRPRDLLARYGGEEFACLLPDTEPEGVKRKAEEFLNAVRELKLPHAVSPTADRVTISLGVAAMIPQTEGASHELLKLADDRLYEAKEAGRNQVAS
ncbi:MAG: diguanylate cyclase domain-containing protein [Nevskiales bacterium]